ncbi:MAG: BA14K family protein [Xanthobacteraceae bacterium]
MPLHREMPLMLVAAAAATILALAPAVTASPVHAAPPAGREVHRCGSVGVHRGDIVFPGAGRATSAPGRANGFWGDGYANYNDPQIAYTESATAVSCERIFPSYDPASGTYLGCDGIRHPCP